MIRSAKRSAALALLGATLGACTVGPDYRQPQVATPERWHEASDDAAPPVRWWSTFGDPTLERLIARAADANLDLRIAIARVREARAQHGITESELWPQVDAAASYQRGRMGDNAARALIGSGVVPISGNQAFWQAGFDASWEVDVFGGVRRDIEAAAAEIEAAEANRRDVLVTLLAEVARNYLDLRGLQREIEIVKANIAAQQETVEITRSRLLGGITSELDVKQAEAQLASTQSQVPVLESAARQAAHRLSVLIGEAPGALADELGAAGPLPPAAPSVPLGLPSDLLRRRPDLQRAERALAAATARIGVATADLYPRFSLTGSYGLRSDTLDDLPRSDSQFWQIGPSVRWPLLDFGRIRSNIAVQDARTEQALLRYHQTFLQALADVESALVAYAKERARHESLVASAEANRRAVEMADQLYQSGITDFLRVLDSQRAQYLAEDLLAQSDRLLRTDLVAIYKALGGGWEEFEPAAPGPAESGSP